MNEAETRAELIDPALKAAGWGVIEVVASAAKLLPLGA
jgi:type I restriction enzyme R subunit